MITTLIIYLKKFFSWLIRVWKSLALFIGSWIMALIIIFLIAIISYSGQVDDSTQLGLSRKVIYEGSEKELAVVRMSGEIASATSESVWDFNPYAITPTNVQSLTKKLSELDNVKAIILVINSPGGSVAASEDIYQQLKILAEVKPVYAYFEETAASGGYYIALPARKIFASIPTITGSIGVIAYDLDISGLMEKTGVKIDTHQSGVLKDFGSYTRPSTEQEKEIFESIIYDSYQLFVDRIEENRELDRDEIIRIADGRVYSAKQAKENGLIDELGSLYEAINSVSTELELSKPTVVEYSLESNIFSGLLGSSINSLAPASLFQKNLLNNKSGLYYY